ncbi:aminotransferase class V-fold PLP-dependent enzyme [Xanthomonas dyei]|uniref:Aminotransferase n=1 Tax=Xanthomonas dyei TaxID=743699 RepID=A0A2S7CCC4_9XANT|nr:aminotransferase class V-fold PLP-dependent enzyme [Xanthomonas dyei]PPU59173.1 aminotransferase [Xanthomonas dyei]
MQSPWESDAPAVRMKQRFALDPGVACLNHGMLGACPNAVLERQAAFRAQIERLPSVFILRDLPRLLDASREALAGVIGADPVDLVLLPNVTTALSAVLRSRSFGPDDEILTTNHAYLSARNLLDFVSGNTGATVVVAQVGVPVSDPQHVVQAVLERVTPRTRLAVLDHVTSPTGIVFPIEALVAALAERGIDTVVDGAHAPGMLPLDVQAMGAAYYAGDCHKWLCSPRGAGFLHVRRDRQAGVHPPVISRGYGDSSSARPRLHLEFDWLGTSDPTPLLCIPEAIVFLQNVLPGGLPAVFAHHHASALRCAQYLTARLPLKRLATDDHLGSMVAVALPPRLCAAYPDAAALQDWLYDTHAIDVAVSAWPDSASYVLRVSMQVYAAMEDVVRLGDALQGAFAALDERDALMQAVTAGVAR